jgi:hypothetical protein
MPDNRRVRRARVIAIVLVAGVLLAVWATFIRTRAGDDAVVRAALSVYGPGPAIRCRPQDRSHGDWWCSSSRWDDPFCVPVSVDVLGRMSVARRPTVCE